MGYHKGTAPVRRFSDAWNSHTIPGCRGGIPNVLARTSSRVASVQPTNIPTVDNAIMNHESTNNGQLTREVTYGEDPIANYSSLQSLRDGDFTRVYPSMDALFEDILHGDGDLFKQAVLLFIDLNTRYYGTC